MMEEPEAISLHILNTITGLDNLLDTQGYIAASRSERLDKIVQSTWKQSLEWRVLEVRFWYPRKYPTSLDVALSVYVSDKRRNSERYFDGRSLEFLVKRSKPYYMPNILGRVISWNSSRFAGRICADTARALKWFELFASPSECLNQLRTGETNGAGAPGGGPYPWFETYFAQLIDSAPPIAEDT